VIQAVEDLGKLDNTIIIYISGDNGASAEGSVTGTPNEVIPFNGIELTAEQEMPWYRPSTTVKANSAVPGRTTTYRPPPMMLSLPSCLVTATSATWFTKSMFTKN
jgi:arylsulfatase A-like enzyme